MYVNEKMVKGSPLHTMSLVFSGQSDMIAKVQVPLNGVGGNTSVTPPEDGVLSANWKANLAGVISNRTTGWDKLVRDLGDRLSLSSNTYASHFCYMVSGANIEAPVHGSRLVLVGADHTIPANASLRTMEAMSAFQRTEAFEWAKRTGNPQACIPP